MQKRSPNQKQVNDRFSNTRINEQIKGVDKVRLVTDDGPLIVTIEEALKKAREAELDLVEVSADQDLHVCKLIDYGKYRFEQLKKTKEAKKKQHVVTIKEIKIRPRIDNHDYEIKKKHAMEFLQKGDKVKVSFPDINKTIDATVSHVGQTVDKQTRTFNVEVRLSNPSSEYKANMITKLMINDDTEKAIIVIPENVVQRSELGEYVLVAENGRAVKKNGENRNVL